jgi:hypothetical protein
VRCMVTRVLTIALVSVALAACVDSVAEPTPMYQDLAATAPVSPVADERGSEATSSNRATETSAEPGSSPAVGPLVLTPTPDWSVLPTITPTRSSYSTPIPPPISSTTPDPNFVFPTIAPTPTPGGIPDGEVVISGTLEVSGDEQETREFVSSPLGDSYEQPFVSCEQYAQGVIDGDRRFFWVPNPVWGWEPEIFDPVDVMIRLQPYAGPGAYDRVTGWTAEEIAKADEDEMGLSFLPSIQLGTIYTELSVDSSVEVAIQPDGSGQFTFTNLHSNAALDTELGRTATSISGQIDWTCAIHHEP